MSEDVTAIVRDHRWLPFQVDLSSDSVLFVRSDRSAHRAATFLDDQILGAASEQRRLSFESLAPALAAAPAGECHFIFHSAFCCSTLLARAVDVDGRSMGLKEPLVLGELAQAALAGLPSAAIRSRLDILLALLARPFAPGEKIIVKPSSVANPIIEEIMSLRPSAKALLVYSPLPDFLRSVAKKGLWGRIWVRRLLASINRRPQFDPGYSEAERWEHSDLQVAALGWLHHHAQFARLAGSPASARVATLDSPTLLEDPARTVSALGQFFALGLDSQQVQAVADGPVFATNSKRQQQAYDASSRSADHAAVDAVIGDEIAMVVEWAKAVAASAGIPMRLPRQLSR